MVAFEISEADILKAIFLVTHISDIEFKVLDTKVKPGDVGTGHFHVSGQPCCAVGWRDYCVPLELKEKWCEAYLNFIAKAYCLSCGIVTANDAYLDAEQRATAVNVAFAAVGLIDDPEINALLEKYEIKVD